MTDITDITPELDSLAKQVAKRRSLVHAKNQTIANIEKQRSVAIARVKSDPLASPQELNHINNHYNNQVADVKAKFKSLDSGYKQAVNVPTSALEKILSDPTPALKNSFQVGNQQLQRVSDYNQHRINWEAEALGVPPTAPGAQRPVYGQVLTNVPKQPFAPLSQYGDTALVLKDNPNAKTSVVQGGDIIHKSKTVGNYSSAKDVAKQAMAGDNPVEAIRTGNIGLKDNLQHVIAKPENIKAISSMLKKAGINVPVSTIEQYAKAGEAESFAGKLATLAQKTGKTGSDLLRAAARSPLSKGLNSFAGIIGFLPMLAQGGEIATGKSDPYGMSKPTWNPTQ
jgi:hypothetical protein